MESLEALANLNCYSEKDAPVSISVKSIMHFKLYTSFAFV